MAVQQNEQSLLGRIQNLLARAEHPNTPAAEAEVCYSQAHKLMTKHAIDEARIRATQSESERRKPVVVDWTWLQEWSQWQILMERMLEQVAETNRVRAMVLGKKVTLVGFSEDVQWVQTLFVTLQLSLTGAMHPKWIVEDGIDANVYKFKQAGFKWYDIWATLYNKTGGNVPCPAPPNDGGYLIRAYKRHMKVVGDTTPLKTGRHEAYRISFANGFVNRISARLERLAAEGREEAASSGAELVLRDSKADVDAAFYELYPELRPLTDEERKRRHAEFLAQEAAREEAERRRWDALTEEQKAKELKAAEAERKRQARQSETYWRKHERRQSSIYSSEGLNAGARAADTVSLSRTTAAEGSNRKEIG